MKKTDNNVNSTSRIPVTKEAEAGAAVYSKLLLSLYDIEVLMFELPFIFKCPLKNLMMLFNENVTANHLDIGVGTGYFLDKCLFPDKNPVIHLMDLNPNSLEKTSKRIRRYQPVTHHWNVLEPIRKKMPVFSSISACNFLHCLPGNMSDKNQFFKNIAPFLCDGGIFFGATVLGQGVDEAGFLYRKANAMYNKSGIFSNAYDNVSDLKRILTEHFKEVSIEVKGSVAIFKAAK